MDLTTATLQELKARLAELPPGDEYNMISNRISELKAQGVTDEPPIDPVIAKANEEVELFGTTLEPFCKNTLSYNVVREKVIAKTYALMDALNEAQAQAEETAAITNSELSELSQQIEDRDAIISGLRKELFEAKELAEDNANKRDAAYRELLEATQTIDALKDKISTLEVEPKKHRTNVEGADTAEEELKKTLPMIYDVEELDYRHSRFRAKFVETEESFEDYFIYKDAKYREVSAEQAVTFRTEYLAQQPEAVEEDHPYDIPDSSEVETTYTAPAFRDTEEDGTTSRLADTASAVAGSTVEERLQALELAVFGTAREAA
jgi:DNA repair exonuclease SbcCD ATPase subunit